MTINKKAPYDFNKVTEAWNSKVAQHEKEAYILQNYNKPDFVSEKQFELKKHSLPSPQDAFGKIKYNPQLAKLKKKQKLEVECRKLSQYAARLQADYKKILSLIALMPNNGISNKLRAKLMSIKANLDYLYDALQPSAAEPNLEKMEKLQESTTKDLSDAKRELLDLDAKYKEDNGASMFANVDVPTEDLESEIEEAIEDKLSEPLEEEITVEDSLENKSILDEILELKPEGPKPPEPDQDATDATEKLQNQKDLAEKEKQDAEKEKLVISPKLNDKLKLAMQNGLLGTQYESLEMQKREAHGESGVDKYLKERTGTAERVVESLAKATLTAGKQDIEYKENDRGLSQQDKLDAPKMSSAFNAHKEHYAEDVQNKLEAKAEKTENVSANKEPQKEPQVKESSIKSHPGYIDLSVPKLTKNNEDKK